MASYFIQSSVSDCCCCSAGRNVRIVKAPTNWLLVILTAAWSVWAAVLVTPRSCYSMADKTALLAYSVSTALPRLNYCCLCHGSVNREYGKPGDFISNRICPHVFCVLNLKVGLSFLTEFCALKRVSSCRHC